MADAFKHIIGHEAQTAYLSRVLQRGSHAHAYCFSGPAHVGKTTVAQAFLRSALGGFDGEITTHPDIAVVRREVNRKTKKRKQAISVDAVRRLRGRLSMSSFGGSRKAALIEEADTMTTAAQNALLKTLEEPKGDALIILTAADAGRLLETIRSRTVHIRFNLVDRETICRFLCTQGLGKDQARALAGSALGRPGAAKHLLDEEQRKAYDASVSEALDLLAGALPDRMKAVEAFAKKKPSRKAVERRLSLWRRLVRDALFVRAGAQSAAAMPQDGRIRRIAQNDQRHLARALRALGEAQASVRQNGNVHLALEHFALSI